MREETTEWKDVSLTDDANGEHLQISAEVRDGKLDSVIITSSDGEKEITGDLTIRKITEMLSTLVAKFPLTPIVLCILSIFTNIIEIMPGLAG